MKASFRLSALCSAIVFVGWGSTAAASFTPYGTHNGWLAAVGGPTIAKDPRDYYTASGQTVDPEIWSDVGLHLLSSGTIETGVQSGWGIVMFVPNGTTLQIQWDYQVSAVWFKCGSPTGSIGFFNGSTHVGSIASGTYGVTSTLSFDRIIISNGGAPGAYLGNIEWAPVPAPGVVTALALGFFAGARRKRRS